MPVNKRNKGKGGTNIDKNLSTTAAKDEQNRSNKDLTAIAKASVKVHKKVEPKGDPLENGNTQEVKIVTTHLGFKIKTGLGPQIKSRILNSHLSLFICFYFGLYCRFPFKQISL